MVINSRDKIYIRRELEREVMKYIKDPEIIAVIGPRQCGKTTLLQHICSNLKNINFITFEDVNTLNLFENDISTFIEQHIRGYNYLAIDEFQYCEKGGKKLKYLYDTVKIKILITGSSSTELSIKGLKYLTGRVLVFNLYPLSFKEFINFKNPRLFNSIDKNRITGPLVNLAKPLLEEFVIYGGYPRIVLERDFSKKKKLLREIYNIYMLKEIKEILGIKDINRLEKLIKTLSLQAGDLIVYDDLCNITGYDYNNLKGQLAILQKTFICVESRPFFTNKRTELVKNPKIFFVDNGLRNSVLNNFYSERGDRGKLYENFICSELVKDGLEIRFWRSKSKAEVDFVIEKEGEVIPIEIKSHLSKTKLTKSFLSFLEKYKPNKGYFFSPEFFGKRVFKKTKVQYYPLFYIYNALREI